MSRDEWWMDYIEDELDKTTKNEMKTLLKSSLKDQEFVQSVNETKTLLKERSIPPAEVPEEFLDDLHDRIMAGIEKTEIKPKPRIRVRAAHKRVMKSASISAFLILSGISLVQHLSSKGPNTQWDISHQIAQQGQESPDELAQMMSYQNEHDFFVDVASLSLDHLTKEQFESLLNSRRTR